MIYLHPLGEDFHKKPSTKHILQKAGIVAATIVIQLATLAAAGILGAGAIATNNLPLSLLAIPAIIGLFSYVIGGTKVTYRFVESLAIYAEKNKIDTRKLDWNPVREAVQGDGFMAGAALFVVITLIAYVVMIASQLGDLGDESYRALTQVIMIPILLGLIVPLIGLAAKLVGNEKAARECGINPNGRSFFWRGGDNRDGSSSGQSDGGSGDSSSSF